MRKGDFSLPHIQDSLSYEQAGSFLQSPLSEQSTFPSQSLSIPSSQTSYAGSMMVRDSPSMNKNSFDRLQKISSFALYRKLFILCFERFFLTGDYRMSPKFLLNYARVDSANKTQGHTNENHHSVCGVPSQFGSTSTVIWVDAPLYEKVHSHTPAPSQQHE